MPQTHGDPTASRHSRATNDPTSTSSIPAHHNGRPATALARPRRWPTVYASAYPPCGGRHRWLILTGACPHCHGGRHVHLVGDPAQARGARRSGCDRGVYWLVIAPTGRAAPDAN